LRPELCALSPESRAFRSEVRAFSAEMSESELGFENAGWFSVFWTKRLKPRVGEGDDVG
jgi:hypothetical protein